MENLDPFRGMDDADSFLYNESIRLEPKNAKQPPKFVSFKFNLIQMDTLILVLLNWFLITNNFLILFYRSHANGQIYH